MALSSQQQSQIIWMALAIIGAIIFVGWWGRGPDPSVQARVPGLDRTDEKGATGTNNAAWEGKLVKGNAADPANFSGVWPGFRGPDLNGISKETVPLAKTMDEQISRLRTWAEGRARNASVPRDGQKASTARRMEL